MAKQCGIIRITGTIGNISFYKTKDGYFARIKGGVDAKRFKTDPKFARSRENAAEFGRAGAAGGVLRRALKPLLANSTDRRLISRLTGALVHVLQGDKINPRGKRCVADGNLLLLQGFEMNSASTPSAVHLPLQAKVSRATGRASVSIPAFDPSSILKPPAGATHFRLVAAGVEADFEQRKHHTHIVQTGATPITAGRQQPVTLQPALTPGTTLPVFLALSIQYLQEVNSTLHPLNTGDYHNVTIIAADSPRQTAGPTATPTQSPQTAPAKYIRKDLLPSAYPNPRAPRTRHSVADRPPLKQSRTKIHSPP